MCSSLFIQTLHRSLMEISFFPPQGAPFFQGLPLQRRFALTQGSHAS